MDKVIRLPKLNGLDKNITRIRAYLLDRGFSPMEIQQYIDFMGQANPLTMFRTFYKEDLNYRKK